MFVVAQAQENVGEAMTFTLVEWAKENTNEILAANVPVVANTEVVSEQNVLEKSHGFGEMLLET